MNKLELIASVVEAGGKSGELGENILQETGLIGKFAAKADGVVVSGGQTLDARVEPMQPVLLSYGSAGEVLKQFKAGMYRTPEGLDVPQYESPPAFQANAAVGAGFGRGFNIRDRLEQLRAESLKSASLSTDELGTKIDWAAEQRMKLKGS